MKFFHKEGLLPINPVLASFVLINWLVFTPSAWRRYVASIDPQLSPDFSLADLKLYHWHDTALWKLLFLGHGLWSVWICSLVTLCLWLLDSPGEILILVSGYALLFSLVGGLLGSFTVSVAFGIMIGIVGSLALLWILLTGNWRQALGLGVGVALFLGLFTLFKNLFNTSTSAFLKPFIIGIHGGIENAMLYLLLFAFPYMLAKRIASPWAGIIAGIFGSAGAYIVFALVATIIILSFSSYLESSTLSRR